MKCPEAENLLNGPPGSSNGDFSLYVDIKRIGNKIRNELSSNNKAVKNLTSSHSSRPRQPQIPNSNGSGTFLISSKKDFQNISHPPYVCLKNHQQTALCDIRKKCLAQNSRQNRRFIPKEIQTEFKNECQDGVKICLRPAFEQSDRYDSVEKRPLAVLRSEKRRQMKSSAWKQQNNWTAPLSRLLSMLFLLTGAVSVEQISRTLTSENHFLETELPVLNVFGIEGGEAKIPCDLTPPRPHDTPNLILISRGATPLYSVDARGGAASSSIHWVNREVLGDRVQFLLPTNFPLLGHSLSQYPVKYNSKIPFFPASSPVYNSNFSNYQSVPLSSEYSYQNSLQRFSTGDDSEERGLYDTRLQRGKAAKVARHAEHNSKYNTNSLAKNNVALKEYDQWPQTVRSFQDLQSKNMKYSQKENKSNFKMRSLAFLQNPKNRTGFEERLTSTVSFHSNKWQEADHVSDASSKSSYVKKSSLQNQLLALSREDLLPEKTPEKIKSDPSKKNYSTRSKDVLDEKFQSSHSSASKDESLSPLFDHSNSTLEIPEVYREVVVPESNIHWSHSHLKLNYWRDILDDTGFKSRLNGRTIRSSQGARDAEDSSEKPPDTAYGILVIRQLLRTDGGKFHCRVDFRQAPTMLSQAKLTVIVPPSSLDIRGVNGLRVTGRVGPYAVGDVLNLWCSAVGGNPQPSVSWWFDGELLDDLSEDQRDDATTNNVTVTGLSRHHLGKSLTCRASNTNLTKPLQSTVTIEMKLPPVSVRITGSQEGVREGRLHKLTCSSEGSHPPAVLTWWARTQQLTHLTYQESPDSTSSTSILHLQPSAADDGLRVSCRATNALLGPAFALEDSVRITVLYSPRVSLRLSPLLNISNINENDDVFLDCDVMANPAVTLHKWHHNGAEVLGDPSRGIVHSNMSLVLQSVSRRSSGKYTCTAYNRLGSATSDELQLTVRFTPVCRGNSVAEENLASLELSPDAVDARGLISSAKDNTNSIRSDTSDSSDTDAIDLDASDGDTAAPKIYGTGVGVAVNITCSVDAHPKPHTFTWSLNATSQEQSQPADDSLRRHHQTRAPNRSRTSTASYGSSSNLLTYTPHTSHEFGTLLCWAQNDVGRQADPCVFQVVPASTPASVHNCTVSPTSPSSPNTLVLRCLPGWDGGLVQSFTLKVMEGKNFSAKSRLNGLGRNDAEDGNIDEWIRGGSVRYIKDQRQTPATKLDSSSRGVEDSRLRTPPAEKGVLAILTGQSSPHFTVSGLAAGQEYVLQVFASNARGDSSPLIVNYMTPIDVAEGRLSSDTAYASAGNGGGSAMVILVVVLAILVVFGGIVTAAIVMLLRRKREHMLRAQNADEDEEEIDDDHRLRATSLGSVAETHAPEIQPGQTEMRDQFASANISAGFCGSSTPTFEPSASLNSSLIPTISSSSSVTTARFNRGPTQRERIVRSLPQEPPDPDILLYRLKSSDV